MITHNKNHTNPIQHARKILTRIALASAITISPASDYLPISIIPHCAAQDLNSGAAEAWQMLDQAKVEEQYHAQGNMGNRLPNAIRFYKRICRERYDSAEAPIAAARLVELGETVPAPDKSYGVTQQNEVIAAAKRQRFASWEGRNFLRATIHNEITSNLTLEQVQEKYRAYVIEWGSKLRRPDICVIPGCPNEVPGHDLCSYHRAECDKLVVKSMGASKSAGSELEQHLDQAKQANTIEAYNQFLLYAQRASRASAPVKQRLETEAHRRIKSIQQGRIARLHASSGLTPAETAQRLKKYEESRAYCRRRLDSTIINSLQERNAGITYDWCFAKWSPLALK